MGIFPTFFLSQYMKRVTATPSLTWAARKLETSTGFLIAFIRPVGSGLSRTVTPSGTASYRALLTVFRFIMTVLPAGMRLLRR